jgi:hypothetical protein
MTSRWTDAVLDQARLQGDAEADEPIVDLLRQRHGRSRMSVGGYNHLVDLATALVAHPELSLVPNSHLSEELKQAGKLGASFTPVEAPPWVDEEKLARGSDLWQSDSILCIAVLYAHSLPACYLHAQGVPALYETDRLAEQKYLFQRIFETALMLDEVMRPGGVTVTHDFERAAHEAGPEARRYIWGSGIVSARKVRYLHAYIRFMLLNPHMTQAGSHPPPAEPLTEPAQSYLKQADARQKPWDMSLGIPINQEDLAFVLLTFGYVIPKGMETWGRRVPVEQKQGFLHLWRVVGYVMGVRSDLMTDDLDEAAALYEQILARHAGRSIAGPILTSGVMNLMRTYLPPWFGIRRDVPPLLIIDQLGPQNAQLIIGKDDYDAARRLLPRSIFRVVKMGLAVFYWVRMHVLAHLPVVGSTISALTEHGTDALIDSWSNSFRRHPFYLAAKWKQDARVTPAYEASLTRWRRKVFYTLAAALGLLVVSGLAFGAALVFMALRLRTERNLSFTCSVAGAVLGILILNGVQLVARRRPRLTASSAS